jgi:heme ABC exporter ATP-binding subunit CcmA
MDETAPRDMTPMGCPSPHPQVLQAAGIVRRFGGTYALRGVDFDVAAGERVALLGPNGAGKTTLIRVLATALRPAAGALYIGGHDVSRDVAHVRCLVGLVGHQTFLYGDLTVRENLEFFGRLYDVREVQARVDVVLETVGLTLRAEDRVRTLSRGLQQRAAMARAILHRPRLLLLDEPETGLDDAAQHGLGDLLSAWTAQGGAVVIATHRLDWAQTHADRVVILDNGRIADSR